MLTSETQFEEMLEVMEGATPAEVLAAASKIDAARWFRRRFGEFGGDEEFDVSAEPMDRFTVPFVGDPDRPVPGLTMQLVPTRSSFEALAYLPFGGFNDCPENDAHLAIHRHWHGRFGAELVTMSGDVLEFQVARPPATESEAIALAKEHYAYCADIVEQGVGSVGALAGALKGAKQWFFWWD